MVADSDRFGELPDEIPDEPDDAQLEHLLKSALTAPKMSPEFSESLGRKLDRQFADHFSAEAWSVNSVSQNGRAQMTKVSSASRKPRTKLRLLATLAAAASLLVAASTWNSRPAYGWAAMIRALEQCNWVQAVCQEPTETEKSLDGENELVASLMQKLAETHSSIDASSLGFELVDESWELIKNPNSTGEVIELHVTLRSLGEKKRPFELIFLLDPKTKLPLSCRLEGEEVSQSVSYDFSYAAQEPSPRFASAAPQSDPATEELASEAEKEPAVVASRESPHASTPAVDPLRTEPLSDQQLVAQLNKLLSEYWQSQGIRPAEPATDAEFLRRVYLDLTGRIPMVSEVYQFLEDPSENRRVRLVDNLLAGRDHATHLAALWRTMLLPEGADVRGLGGTAKFDEWLADRFGENLPYDQLVSQLLLAEGRVRESGPLLFYATLKLNPEEIAAKTSRVFLGTRLECAQCHDHPFDEKISQLDFWGFAAFFAQISRPLGKMDSTSPVLRVRDNRQGEVKLPESEEVVFPKLPGDDKRTSEAGAENGPSRRRQLVEWLVSPDNTQFSRAAVNRVWELLFGRGIIDPVDDMRADVEPAMPGVLEALARDFTASRFDLRRLLRAIVLSDAYQLSSRVETDDPSQTLCFARMNMKSLTASQLYDCIAVATRREEPSHRSSQDGAVLRINNPTREAFIAQFRAPPGQRTDYQAGIPQALTLMHGQLIHQATDLASSGLLKSLGAPFFSDQQRVDTLFLATLSRMPEFAERQEMVEYVAMAATEEERQHALGDVLWALLNSAEFTFNH